MDRSIVLSLGNVGSFDCFVLDDQVLWLDRWSAWLSGSEGCFRNKDALFEEVLLDELFQILSEGLAMDSLVSLTFMIRAIFFCSRKCEIVSHWSRAPKRVAPGYCLGEGLWLRFVDSTFRRHHRAWRSD